MYSLPRCVLLIIWSVSIFYFTHFWINGLLSKQSSLQMVWERLHSTITLLVGYIFFFPKVYKYNIVTDIIHNTFPLGQTGVCICVLNHVKKKKKLLFHIKNNEQGWESPSISKLLWKRCSVPPPLCQWNFRKNEHHGMCLAPQKIGLFCCLPSGVCTLFGICLRGFDLQYWN